MLCSNMEVIGLDEIVMTGRYIGNIVLVNLSLKDIMRRQPGKDVHNVKVETYMYVDNLKRRHYMPSSVEMTVGYWL